MKHTINRIMAVITMAALVLPSNAQRQISTLPEVTSPALSSITTVDVETSPGVWRTRKITLSNLGTAIGGSGSPGSGTVTSVGSTFTGGIISVTGSPITSTGTLAYTVAGTSGGIPYFNSATGWASSAALAANSLVIGGGAGAAPSTVTTGTGVLTALGVNTGSAGSVVLFNGAGGTPSSLTLTNATGLPVSTGISGLGTGVASFLATPSSAALRAAVTDETGSSGGLVFSGSPTLTTPILGVATATSINGLTITSSTGTLTIANGKTASISNTMTFTGTDGTSHVFPSTSSSLARKDAAQTFSGDQTFSGGLILTGGTIDVGDATLGGSIFLSNTAGSGHNITSGATGGVAKSVEFPDASGNVLLDTATQTVSGKSLSGATNTFTNIPLSTAVTGTLPVANGGTGITAFGTGVATALGVNTGTAGAFVVNGGALGTPSSGTLTNATGLPLTTGVTGTLPVANGGTGATSLTANNVLLGNGTSAVQVVAPGASGNVLTSNGTTWQSTAPSGGSGGPTYVHLASDVANSTTSFADVTGLSFSATSGETYWFEAQIVYTSSVTTNGSKWAVNGPTSTVLSYRAASNTATTTDRVDYAETYDGTAASAQTSSMTLNYANITGIVKVSASGTFVVRFGCETTGTITAKAGSVLIYKKIAP